LFLSCLSHTFSLSIFYPFFLSFPLAIFVSLNLPFPLSPCVLCPTLFLIHLTLFVLYSFSCLFQTEEDEEEESEPIYQNQGQILIAQQQLGQQQQLDQQQQQQLNHQQQQLNLQQQLLEQQQQQLLEQQQQLLEQQQQLEQEQQEVVPGQEPIYQNLPLHEKLNQSYTGEEEQDESIHIGQCQCCGTGSGIRDG
jgi:hypothetical protein